MVLDGGVQQVLIVEQKIEILERLAEKEAFHTVLFGLRDDVVQRGVAAPCTCVHLLDGQRGCRTKKKGEREREMS